MGDGLMNSSGTIPFGVGKGNVQVNNVSTVTSALETSVAGTYNLNGFSGNGFLVHGGSDGVAITVAVGNNDAFGDFSGIIRLETPLTPGTRTFGF